jgi:hypothetical protein
MTQGRRYLSINLDGVKQANKNTRVKKVSTESDTHSFYATLDPWYYW